MGLTDGKRMYHLLIQKEGTQRQVPLEALAASEAEAMEFIPAGFRLVCFTDRYYWPPSEENCLPDGPPEDL